MRKFLFAALFVVFCCDSFAPAFAKEAQSPAVAPAPPEAPSNANSWVDKEIDELRATEKDSAPAPKPETFASNMEWVALHFGAGLAYGGGVSFFTLRWKHVVWEVARGEFHFSYSSRDEHLNGRTVWSAGSALGYPLFLDNEKRHELRFETGVFAGIWAMRFGPFIMAEASYLYHVKKHFAIQTALFFYALGYPNGVPFRPIFSLQVGLRF